MTEHLGRVLNVLTGAQPRKRQGNKDVDDECGGTVSKPVPSLGIGTIQQPAMPSGLLDFFSSMEIPRCRSIPPGNGVFFCYSGFRKRGFVRILVRIRPIDTRMWGLFNLQSATDNWQFFWRGTQVVRERSAKPLCAGSIPARASIHFKLQISN